MLVDIVSQNGNLLLNFQLPNSGQLNPDELKVLRGITDWMAVNSEGIYGTRPWKIYGEGPSTHLKGPRRAMNEGARKLLTASEVRFTTKRNTLYAFIMGWPEGDAVVQALGTASPQSPEKIERVELLGYHGSLKWTQ